MRPRSVLVLAVLVAGLLAFIVLYERDLPSSEERTELARKVLRVDSDEIAAIEIESEAKRVHLRRQEPDTEQEGDEPASLAEASWQIIEPITARADKDHVERLLRNLTAMEKKRTLEGISAAEVGVDKPRARVVVHAAGSRSTLLVGAEIPASSSMIVADEDLATYFVVDNALWADIDRSAGDWRSRRVFPWSKDEIEQLALSSPEQRLVMARSGEEFWLESPVADRADEDLVRDLVGALTSMRVSSFVDDPVGKPADLGLEPPIGAIEVSLSHSSEPFILRWGGLANEPSGAHYAEANGQVFATLSDLTAALRRSAQEWQSLEVVSLQTFQIDEARIADAGDVPLTLSRAGADWKRNDDEISFTTVSELLYSLSDLRAERLLIGDQAVKLRHELEEAELTIDLDSGERQERVRFFRNEGAEVVAEVDDREVLFVISDSDYSALTNKLLQVRRAEARSEAAAVPSIDVDSGEIETPKS